MSSWNLELNGTTRSSHGPRLIGILNLVVRRRVVSPDISSRTTTYGYPIEVARTPVALPLPLLQSPMGRYFFIKYALASLSVDRLYQSSFTIRILRAARDLSNRYPQGFRLTVILDHTIAENLGVEDLVIDSESSRVMSESIILGLKEEEVYPADDQECCSICLEHFHRAEKVTELPCSHVFHRPCIIRWLESSGSCPLCRCQLDS